MNVLMNEFRHFEIGFIERSHIAFRLEARNGSSWLLPINELGEWVENFTLPIPVTFGLMRMNNWLRERPMQISPIGVETDIELLRECYFAANKKLWIPVLESYLSLLSSKNKVEAIVAKLKLVKDKEHESLLLSALKNCELLTFEAIPLHKRIGFKRRWEVLEEAQSSQISDEIINSLVNIGSERFDDAFWVCRPRAAKAVRLVIPFAPNELRDTLFKETFAEYCTAVSISPNHGQVSIKAGRIVRELTDKDRELAKLWAGKEANKASFETNYTRMLSARNAEKAAAQFFEGLGYEVSDIAIQQVTTKEKGWQTHDLLLDGTKEVDVKNARPASNNKNAYAELTVPQFKYSRTGEDVLISGVFSPHQWIWELDSSFPTTNEPWGKNSKQRAEGKLIVILGITSKGAINNLERVFETGVLKVRTERIGDEPNKVRKTIPPWVFDYPEVFYEPYRKQLLVILNLEAEQIPSARLILAIEKKLTIGLFVAAGRRPPDNWLATLEKWHVSYLDQLLSLKEKSLPMIFLTILRHFTEAVSVPPDLYDPMDYFTLIECEGYPLGRHDPLKSVVALCKSLHKLWSHRELIGLHEFKRFEFQGMGILRGKKANSGHLTTIMAYCGGKTDKGVKCGYPDLILGNLDIQECTTCHRLICPQCAHCKQNCPDNEPRQSALSESDELDDMYWESDPFESDFY